MSGMSKKEYFRKKQEVLDNLNAGEINDVDEELRNLITLMNKVPGITTLECCVGHGKSPCHIWFRVLDLDVITKFSFYCIDCCHHIWNLCYDIADVKINKDPNIFFLESKTKDMEEIVEMISSLERRLERNLATGVLI